MHKTIAKLQYITQESNRFSHAEQARIMFERGVNWVQMRMKKSTEIEIQSQCEMAMLHAQKYGGTLIINDNIHIAKSVGAHGVHLGLKDVPIDEARLFLGDDFIIGGTANTFNDLLLQYEKGADYVGLGPFRFTTTKQNLSAIIGLDGYRTICAQAKANKVEIPIIAVGGITLDDVPELECAGIFGVAISGALLKTIL